MSARSALLTLLALGPLACAGGSPESPDVGWPDAGVEAPDAGRDGSSPDAAEPPPEGRALFTTALGDDGRLYEVDLATREVTLLASFRQPTSTMTGGQRGVHVAPEVPGTVYLYGGERIERYRWGAWDAPQTRWSVAHGRALTGVELCDGRLFVALGPPLDWMSPTSASALLAFDPTTGAPAGEIDLSALLPGERPLVVASLVQIGLVLYVSLFRGGDGLPAEPLGRIAAIECSPGAMGRILTWDVAPGATLHARAGLSPNVWVVTPKVSTSSRPWTSSTSCGDRT